MDKGAIRAEGERLFALFQRAGAVPIEADYLQPADTLLDLYGEDIRARAYVTSDPVRGEQMLRPDFTVPVVQRHMETGAEPARYTYLGEVFRKQDAGTGRASEYLQVGYELFEREDPETADAEVFALFAKALEGRGLTASIGDIGILTAAVQGLTTSERRKRALMRHIWRPARFRTLLQRFAGQSPLPAGRAEMIALSNVDAAVTEAGPEIGIRTAGEVRGRIVALQEDASASNVPEAELRAIERVSAISCDAKTGLGSLREIVDSYPVIGPAVDRFASRLDALVNRGIDPSGLLYEGAYGMSNMEYYDGFVFGFSQPGQPVVATGGRYDALTSVLGDGRAIPAVGGVIRPELALRAGVMA